MLSAVLLHKIKTAAPINMPRDCYSGFKRLIDFMPDNAVFILLNVKHVRVIKSAKVAELAATFRKKRRFVKCGKKSALRLLPEKHRGGKFGHIRVFIKKSFCRKHKIPPNPKYSIAPN